MKALTFQGKECIQFASVPDPVILHPADAIVRVNQCAICGSDLHVYHEREKESIGAPPWGTSLPVKSLK